MEKKIKILNLYAGVGGNRKLIPKEFIINGIKYAIEVTAVEIDSEIATIYKKLYPEDKVIIGDAHQYLLEHHKEFDFIWSSPPCPTHSQFRQRCGVKAWGFKPEYPDMTLWQEIIFMQYHAVCPYVIENVEPYYPRQFNPFECGRHLFWSNFHINNKDGVQPLAIKTSEVNDLEILHNINLKDFKIKNKRQILRNCVLPELGLHVFECAFKKNQKTVGDFTQPSAASTDGVELSQNSIPSEQNLC